MMFQSNFAKMKVTELKLHPRVLKGGEYDSDAQNLDICETRKLYVSKSNFATMKATELKLHSHGSQGWRMRIRHSNLDICETRKLYISKSYFANMKATELKLHPRGSQGCRIRFWRSTLWYFTKLVNMMFQSLTLRIFRLQSWNFTQKVPKGGEYESDTQNLDICGTRKLYVSKSNFANMKAIELKLHWHGSQGWRIRIRHSKYGHLRNS